MRICEVTSRSRTWGRRKWTRKCRERDAVYANRRRIRGTRGARLLRRRGELLERPFAYCYETGGMRRTHLRGHRNIQKRILIHVATGNLGLLMRRLLGAGTPRALADLAGAVRTVPDTCLRGLGRLVHLRHAIIGRLSTRGLFVSVSVDCCRVS